MLVFWNILRTYLMNDTCLESQTDSDHIVEWFLGSMEITF